MAGKAELYKIIHREYEELRWANLAQQRKKREQIFAAVPRIKEIEETAAMTGIRLSKLVLENPADLKQHMQNLEESLLLLRQEKRALLTDAGFSEADLELSHHCKLCQDTGYIDTKPCSCLKQRLMEKAYQQSNLQDILKIENFDSFDIRFYSDKEDPEEGTSPRANIQEILRACLSFTQNFDTRFTNLFLYGKTGLGKTFLCNCMAKELLDQGKTVLYLTAGQLFKRMEAERFHRSEEEEPMDFMEDILAVDLFMIDDLGTEFSTILSSAELFFIINARMLAKKPVVISTNLAPADFINQYSDRIVSRLLGEYQAFKFFGEDIRIQKKFQGRGGYHV